MQSERIPVAVALIAIIHNFGLTILIVVVLIVSPVAIIANSHQKRLDQQDTQITLSQDLGYVTGGTAMLPQVQSGPTTAGSAAIAN